MHIFGGSLRLFIVRGLLRLGTFFLRAPMVRPIFVRLETIYLLGSDSMGCVERESKGNEREMMGGYREPIYHIFIINCWLLSWMANWFIRCSVG